MTVREEASRRESFLHLAITMAQWSVRNVTAKKKCDIERNRDGNNDDKLQELHVTRGYLNLSKT